MIVAGVESMTIVVPLGSMMYIVHTTLDPLYWEMAGTASASVALPSPLLLIAIISLALKFRLEVPFISHSRVYTTTISRKLTQECSIQTFSLHYISRPVVRT